MKTETQRHADKLETARAKATAAVIAWAGEPGDRQLTERARAAMQDYEYELLVEPDLPEAAAGVISSYFISPPENVEVTRSAYLGNGHWNVDTNIQYGGTDRSEPRSFLLVQTTDGRLLVNP